MLKTEAVGEIQFVMAAREGLRGRRPTAPLRLRQLVDVGRRHRHFPTHADALQESAQEQHLKVTGKRAHHTHLRSSAASLLTS